MKIELNKPDIPTRQGLFATMGNSQRPIQGNANFPLELNAKTPEEIIELLLNNPELQRALAKQDESSKINYQLANDVLSVLNEIEGNYYDETTRGIRYVDWETKDIPYTILKRAAQTEPARLIINKRRLDLAQYGVAPKEEGIQRGFTLRFRRQSPSKEEKALLSIWQQKFIDTFFFAPNDDHASLSKFIGSSYEDWFTYDDMTYEVRRDRLGSPLAIHQQDPIIYKPTLKKRNYASINDEELDAKSAILGDYSLMQLNQNIFEEGQDNIPDYVGIYKGYEFAHLMRDVLYKSHFFIRSDFRNAKRGYSVTEQGLNLVSYLVNTLTMNASNFNRSRIPDGILVFDGIGQFQLEKLRKVISAYVNGTTNSNRLPMVDINREKGSGKGAEYIHFRPNSREMEYHLWWSLLFSIWCQLSGTDPNEVSMSSHKDAVGKRSLFQESSDGIIKESRDIGAKTFLTHFANTLNIPAPKYKKNVFQQVTGLDVECAFVGFEMEDKKLKYEIYTSEMKTTGSRNELLTREDKEPQELMIDLGDNKKVNYFDLPGTQDPQLHAVLINRLGAAQQEKQLAVQQQVQAGAETTEEGEQLTDEDKKLIEEYGDNEDVNIDDKLKQELMEEELEEEEDEENELENS